jgi:Na+-translocating ferredoxin:NAD+ oxidoreductase RnfC subunit
MAAMRKQEVITFKVDPGLSKALEGIPDRSEFIRCAILAAMENLCPLCKGTGLLSPDQRRHWEEFARTHSLRKCSDCDATLLVCAAEAAKEVSK